MITFVDVTLEVHEAFERAAIAHAFGGAIALAYAIDEPRTTRDVDVNVFVPADACRRAFEALPPGVAWNDEDVALAERDGQVRLHRDEIPVDLFFDYHEIHAAAAAHARVVPFADSRIPVLGPAELAVFKAFFDRGKDWIDLEWMSRSGSIDPHQVARALGELLGEDDHRVARLRSLPSGPEEEPPPRILDRR